MHEDEQKVRESPTDISDVIAASFTDARKRQIAEIDEEISVIEDYRAGCISTTDEHATVTRTLSRLQAARAELRRGMRGEA